MTEYVNGKAGAREDLCRFLAACYYQPAAEFVEERLFDSMLAAATAIDPDLAEAARRLGQAFAAQNLETLLVDYTRLFIGPAQPLAMPYASYWLTDDPSLRHEATTAVLDLYEQGGFDISEDFRELPDHVAAELEFLYLLIFSHNEASLGGNEGGPSALDELRRGFVLDHLGVWLGKFAERLKTVAETAFYRELAGFTERFVLIEARSLMLAVDSAVDR